MSDEIEKLKSAAGEYKLYALQARKAFINLRLTQDVEIRQMYTAMTDRISKKLRQVAASSPTGMRKRQLEQLESHLRHEGELLKGNLTSKLTEYIRASVETGTGISQNITFKVFKDGGFDIDKKPVLESFSRVNKRAVEAVWSTYKKGMKLSDRIWNISNNNETAIRNIIQDAVATGQDAVTTARLLEKYVRADMNTLAKDYPDMMKRLQGRIPGDISYEALRLARTETSNAFWRGTVEGARNSPTYAGVRWVLSPSHPVRDICDTYAEHDEGLGEGVFSPGNEPMGVPHPNCMCIVVAVHDSSEDVIKKLNEWQKNPQSQPDIEAWYQKTYNGITPDAIMGIKTGNLSPDFNDDADRQMIAADLMQLPLKQLELLRNEGIALYTGWTGKASGYYHNEKAIKLIRDVEPGETLHEIGHFLDSHHSLYKNEEFIKIIADGIPVDKITHEHMDIFSVPSGITVLLLAHPEATKFISWYQSAIYPASAGNDIIFDVTRLREYFSEGLREFYFNPQNLNKKDRKLFEFIERMMKE
jgi:hypothetical protein